MNDVLILSGAIVVLAAFVAAPLYRKAAPLASRTDAGPAPEQAREEAVQRALADLEIDRATGLLDDADYDRERRTLGTPD